MVMIAASGASHLFQQSFYWLSENVEKSRFSRIAKKSREFSLLDLDPEALWFYFSLLENEWKHFYSTLHFSKKSESHFFHFPLLEKEWKLLFFIFHFSDFPDPLSQGPVGWMISKFARKRTRNDISKRHLSWRFSNSCCWLCLLMKYNILVFNYVIDPAVFFSIISFIQIIYWLSSGIFRSILKIQPW